MSDKERIDVAGERALAFSANIHDAFDHAFLWGLTAIIEAESDSVVALRWRDRTTAELYSPTLLDIAAVANSVQRHVQRHAQSLWLTETNDFRFSKDPKKVARRSPLSPRIGSLTTREDFEALELARHELIDDLEKRDWLTRRLLGALGRPSDWSRNDKGELLSDFGASAWEMKTRNRGEEFIQNRLSPLARFVAKRKVDSIASGLLGESLMDEAGKNDLASRTSTGLRAPGPTDNARAWCALWGLSAFPVQPVTGQSESARQHSVTAGAVRLPPGAAVYFVLPIPERHPKTVDALRAIVRSTPLTSLALAATRRDRTPSAGQLTRDIAWLSQHDIASFVLFERVKSDNTNAPELSTLPGTIHPVAEFATTNGTRATAERLNQRRADHRREKTSGRSYAI